jgi:hypothetical protein
MRLGLYTVRTRSDSSPSVQQMVFVAVLVFKAVVP